MSTSSRRSAAVREDDELRLPRPPGVIRRFWARHPLLADVLIALLCLILSVAPATTLSSGADRTDYGLRVGTTELTPTLISVVIVIACALLVRRRQWPVAAFIGALAVALSYLSLSLPVGGPLLLVTIYTLAVYRSSRAAWTAFTVGVTVIGLVSGSFLLAGAIPLSVAINAIVGELVLGLFGVLIGVNVGNRKRYLDAVIDRSRQLLVERDQHAQLAAAGERDRIAREMHDIVSHSLTVIVALSDGAAATADRDRARDASSAAASTARNALSEMRAMLGILRDDDEDAALAPISPVSPHATVTAAQRAGYPVALTVTGERDVGSTVGFAVGRIVQEGMTNAMRHAPGASQISVRVDYSADRVTIDIDNDGVVATTAPSGFGLRGLSERAAHVDGTVRSGPAGPGLWSLHAEIPAPMPGAPASEARPLTPRFSEETE